MKKTVFFLFIFCPVWVVAQQFVKYDEPLGDISSIAFGDIDSDNDNDIAFIAGNSIYWSENKDGLGNFGGIDESFKIVNNQIKPLELECHDIDQDGDMDIIFNNYYFLNGSYTGNIVWMENLNGIGNEWSYHEIVSDYYHSKINVQDFDMDGDNDLVGFLGHQLYCFENVQANFTPVLIDSIPDQSAKIFDVDNDGDNDIAYIKSGSDSLFWKENMDGKYQFSDDKFIVKSFGNNIQGLIDFNGDSLIDMILLGNNLYENKGQGQFNYKSLLPNTGSNAGIVGDMDFNQDGKKDIYFTRLNKWLKNLGGGVFQEAEMWTDFNEPLWNFSVAPDINGDNYPDILALYSSKIFCLENTNMGDSFEIVSIVEPIPNNILNVELFDIDADGDLDAFEASNGTNHIGWYENIDGHGKYSFKGAIASLSESNTFMGGLELEYLDSNNHIDLIWFGEKTYLLKDINEYGAFTDFSILTNKEILRNNLEIKDREGDGDMDIFISTKDENTCCFQLGEIIYLENINNSGNFNSSISILPNEDDIAFPTFMDITNDGIIDLIISNELETRIGYYKGIVNAPYFSGFIMIDTLPFGSVSNLIPADIDGDNDNDIFIMKDFSPPIIGWYENIDNGNNFEYHDIEVDQVNLLTGRGGTKNIIFDDFDNDNDLDFVTLGHLNEDDNLYYFKNTDGQGDFKVSVLTDFPYIYSFANGDIDDDGDIDLLTNALTKDEKIIWLRNTFFHDYWVEGKVFKDVNENCADDDTLNYNLPNWIIHAIDSNEIDYYTVTDTSGNYDLAIDSGNFTLNVNLPNDYWETCFQDSTIYMPPGGDTITLDFPVQAEFDCPVLTVEINTWAIRPCMESNFSVHYCNDGTVPAEDAYIEVRFDSILSVTGSSIPWASFQDSTYTFEIGDVEIGECGQFNIYAEVDCNAPLGDINCASARIFPDTLCNFPALNWDGSNIVVGGRCENDTVVFKIENTGTGNMADPLDYIVQIVNDDIIMFLEVDIFQLDAGDSTLVALPAQGLALKMQAEQSPNNPVSQSDPIALVPNCDSLLTDSIFFVLNQFPMGNGDPFSDQACLPVTGSYDPNDKQAFPAGIGPGHLVEPDWEIEYLIRFQNTGTDTAFTMVIRDTLSPFLDPSTVRPGAASHSYTWELTGEGALSFTFDDILLPDSNTNEALSHGFVGFTIEQKEDIVPGTVFENRADIYFDFNDPIRTNTVFHEVIKHVVYEIEPLEFCGETDWNNYLITQDTIIADTTFMAEYDSVTLFDVVVNNEYFFTFDTLLHQWEMWNGQYFSMDTSLVDSTLTIFDCDSVLVTNINAIPLFDSDLEAVICEGDAWGGVFYIQDTVLIDTFISTIEDTILMTDLMVEDNYETTIDTMLLYGEPYFSDTTVVFNFTALNGCDSTVTWNIDVTVNTAEHFFDESSFIIQPNPTAGLLNCYFKNMAPVVKSVSLWNAAGKELVRIPVSRSLPQGSPLQLDIGGCPSGVHWLKLKTGMGVLVKKVVKTE